MPDLADAVREQFDDRTEDPLDDPGNHLVQHGGVEARREAPEQHERDPPESEAHEGHHHPGNDHALPPPAPLLAEPPPQPVEAEELGDDHQREADDPDDEGAQDQVREGAVRDQEPADAGREHTQEEHSSPVNRPVGQTPDRHPADEPHTQEDAEPGREDRAVERGASEGAPVREVIPTPHGDLVDHRKEESQRRQPDEAEDESNEGETDPLEGLGDHDDSSKRRYEVRTPCPLAQRFQSVVMRSRNNMLELSKEQTTIAHFAILSSFCVRQTNLFFC